MPTEGKSGGSEATDPDVGRISLTYDEDCSIEGPDILMARFPSLASACAEFVDGLSGLKLRKMRLT